MNTGVCTQSRRNAVEQNQDTHTDTHTMHVTPWCATNTATNWALTSHGNMVSSPAAQITFTLQGFPRFLGCLGTVGRKCGNGIWAFSPKEICCYLTKQRPKKFMKGPCLQSQDKRENVPKKVSHTEEGKSQDRRVKERPGVKRLYSIGVMFWMKKDPWHCFKGPR